MNLFKLNINYYLYCMRFITIPHDRYHHGHAPDVLDGVPTASILWQMLFL